MALRHKSQNYQTNLGNSFELRWLRFEEEGQGRRLTRADFAKRLGVSRSYLYAIEHRRNEVGAEALLGISLGFGKSLEWLFRGEE